MTRHSKSILHSLHALTRLAMLLTFALGLSQKATGQTPADSIIKRQLEDMGIAFTTNNSVTLLPSGEEKFQDMFQAIRQAKHHIHLEYFNFRNDSIANLLFDLLAEKHKEGVEVRALFDAFGNDSNNRPLKKYHLRDLWSRGIQIYEFDPIRFPWVNHVFSRDHRKIVVIDGVIAYTGGMNVADYYINGTEQVGEWHDMHCRIEGDAVCQLQRIFLNLWAKVTKQQLPASNYMACGNSSLAAQFKGLKADPSPTAGQKKVAIVNREPRSTNKDIRLFYLNAINSARDSIKLINPYLTLSPTLKKALRRAINRGVDLQIMVSEKSDIPLTPDCVLYNVHKLMKQGAKVWIYKPGFHHTKTITIDGRYCTVGSANLNSRSLRFDYEENAVILDPHTTRQLDRMFNDDKQKSFLLTDQSWDDFRTGWQKFRGWFAHLLAPFL